MAGDNTQAGSVRAQLELKKFSDDDKKAWSEVGSKGGEYNRGDNLEGLLIDALVEQSAVWDLLRWLLAATGLALVAFAIIFAAFPYSDVDAALADISTTLGLSGLLASVPNGNLPLNVKLLVLLVGVAALGGVAFNILRLRRSHRASIDQLRAITKGARQIYLGSGQLIFTCGNKGIRVTNALRSLSWEIDWNAVAPFQILLQQKAIKGLFGKVQRYEFTASEAILPNQELPPQGNFTHLFVFTTAYDRVGTEETQTAKLTVNAQRPAVEYLVIPLRLFSGIYDTSAWQQFVQRMHKYISETRPSDSFDDR